MKSGSCIVAALALFLAACGDHDHGEGGHDHAAGHAEGGDHGHGPEGADDPPGVSVTIWAEHNELFMEYGALTVGTESRFAAHVTTMPAFQAATAGTVTATLRQADGKELVARADAPSSPGIFRPTITPTAAGPCTLTIAIERDGAREVLPIEGCQVYPDLAAARAAHPEEEDPPGRITYLKEQAWKTEFAVVEVAERPIEPSIRVSGEIKPVAGKEARIGAPAAGRVVLATPVPVLGMQVKAGQVLATIVPRLEGGADRATLDAEAAAAVAELAAAESELARAERLFAEKTIAEKQVVEARTRVELARARRAAATGRQAQWSASVAGGRGGRGSIALRAPIAGTLVAADVASGQGVAEGDELFAVVDLSRVWVEARLFEADAAKVQDSASAHLHVDGMEAPRSIAELDGRRVAIGRMIDPVSRTVPVLFEVANPGERLFIGQHARVWLATAPAVTALAIPEEAVLDDAGRPVAYVMVEGESFERRVLTLGHRAAGWVQVKDGLTAGEHVVTRGAYDIKLASSSGAVPAHGHAH